MKTNRHFRRIIVPAAGKAIRFGGCPKELLPIQLNECCLTRAVRMAKEIGNAVIITSNEKQMLHERVLRQSNLIADCQFIQQGSSHKELWGAIRLGLEKDRPGGIILADTITSLAQLPETIPAGITFGVFPTETPDRFSVVEERFPCWLIHTKKPLAGLQNAWGVVLWDAQVTNFFIESKETFQDYDRAFEFAANMYSASTFALEYYYDIGTFPAYLEFLSAVHLSNRSAPSHD